MDISAVKQIPIFNPLFGFSGISSPKINVELETFVDGTYNYPRHVVKGANVGNITFTRAASLYDSDFYDWIYYAINGVTTNQDAGFNLFESFQGTVRRDLLILQFARINLAPSSGDPKLFALAAIAAGLTTAITAGATTGLAVGAVGVGLSGVIPVGPFTFASWLPARAWKLHNCIPTSYSSSTDFAADSGDISLMSLTLQPELITEFSFGLV